jgi:DNA mismatch repair protein MutS2
MELYPSSAEEKLGFDVVRERLDGYTRSTLGQSRLANMRPSASLEWVRAELERVSELQQAFRFDDPVPLDHVLDVRGVLRRAAPEEAVVGPEDLRAVQLVLATLRRTRSYFETRKDKYPRLHTAAARITLLQPAEEGIARIVDEEGRVRDDASPELRRLRRLVVLRQSQLREMLQDELRRAVGLGYATEEQPTIRNGRMVIPIRAEAKRKVAGFVQDVSATGQTVYIEPAVVLDLNNEVRELQAEEHREVERILRGATAMLRSHLPELRTNLKALAQFDLLQAKARLANELDAAVPQLNEEGRIHIRSGRNPVLQLRFKSIENDGGAERRVVPLDLALGEAYRTLIITGPNAGGKTVAMKTVGLFALMLAYGLPLPLDSLSQMAVFEHLIVDIGDEQSMEEDLSTFSSHVGNLKYMLRHADARTLILIDEAGTGTDPTEGGALAQAVLEHLTEQDARTIATTHHGTLKVFAHETPLVENGSMQFDLETLSPTYRFQPGVPGSSFAFDIANRIGLEKSVLDRARELTGQQSVRFEELIATFQARNLDLEQRLETVRTAQEQAETEREVYRERLERLEQERDRLRSDALAEAERIVQEANAQVERTIREIKEAQAEKEATRLARTQLDTYRQQIETGRSRLEHKRQQRSRQGKRPSRTERAHAPAEAIAVGDQVVVDGGTAAAEVLEIDDGKALIALGSVRMRAELNRLQKVGGPRKQQVTVRHTASESTGLSSLKARNSIDLRGRRVDEALQEVTPFLDEAVMAGLKSVDILHGKGTGALREAIRDILRAYPDVADFDDAPWNQGGAGVTRVTFS